MHDSDTRVRSLDTTGTDGLGTLQWLFILLQGPQSDMAAMSDTTALTLQSMQSQLVHL
jgi:hypothetical protein